MWSNNIFISHVKYSGGKWKYKNSQEASLQCIVSTKISQYRMTRCSYFTRSPFVPCLSWLAQSGTRTCFERRVWFIESHIVLVIFFVLIDLFIHLFLIWKACCYPVKQLNNFLVKYYSHFTCSPTLTLFSYYTAVLPDCLCPLSAANHFLV